MKKHKLNPSDFVLDEIVEIEFIGDRDTIDIVVEDTHMFYANDVYSHNSSTDEEIIEANKVAESFNKIMIADFIISLQRKRKDKLAHTGRVHVIKNRFGPDGFTFPSKMNAATGQIQMFEDKSDDGKNAKRESEKGEISAKRELSARIDDILGSVNKKVDDMG